MDISYWENFYLQNPHPFNPSAFATAVAPHISGHGLLLDLGCGNARDAVFFSSKLNINVLAIDQCESEIARLKENFHSGTLDFVAGDFTQFTPPEPPRYVYSRWTMHAIDLEAEDRTLAWVSQGLCDGGKLFIEARSIRDDLYGKGKQVGEHAFFSDHYRRFMDRAAVSKKLEGLGMTIVESVESRGLAVYKDDDPVIVRLIAQK